MRLDRLDASYIEKKKLPTKVIQFGEGNFLRAFFDWQIQQMNNQGLFNGGIAVVQPLEDGRTEELDSQDNLYTLLLQGRKDGKPYESSEIIESINKTVRPYDDYDSYLSLATDDNIEIIVSNTTEAGISFNDNDQLTDRPQKSYPGKLTALLYKRFKLGKKGFIILPCELIKNNGTVLKTIVLDYAKKWNLGTGFISWINNENKFYSTLVDRIVPGYPLEQINDIQNKLGYLDKCLVKAEPFMLFVIEADESIEEILPFSKSGLNTVLTSDIQPYRDRKVSLLNGPHTSMSILGRLMDLESVTQVMQNNIMSQFIYNEMMDEIIPTIRLPKTELIDYSKQVMERFDNPFINHKLSSIALNSISKVRTRLLPSFIEYYRINNKVPKHITLVLSAYIYVYTRQSKLNIYDTKDVLDIFEQLKKSEKYVELILSSEKLWGEDMTKYFDLTEMVEEDIQSFITDGVEKTIKKRLD